MMKKGPLILANFKTHGSWRYFENYFQDIVIERNVARRLIFCPPFPYLHAVGKHVKDCGASLGAQDCIAENSGTCTGGITPTILKDCGVQYVILGHSERRHFESVDMVREKIQSAIAATLTVILCVGESKAIRADLQAKKFLQKELQALIPQGAKNIIIAYEPVWAVGAEKPPATIDIEEACGWIREFTKKEYPVLYGGSVNSYNAGSILACPSVHGLLVGRACLAPHSFSDIISLLRTAT